MATIALVVEMAFGARVLLQTQVLDSLVGRGARVVVLTSDPEGVRACLRERGHGEIPVERLPVEAYEREGAAFGDLFFRRCRQWGVDVKTMDDIYEMEAQDTAANRARDLPWLRRTWRVGRAMRRNAWIQRTVMGVENRLRRTRHLDGFFRRYRPDVVVLTSLGTFASDRFVIREAKANGSRVVSYVLSWDNPTTRGLGVGLVDDVIVWSTVMKEELLRLHRIPARRIHVGGVPHYDVYVNGNSHLPSKQRLAEIFGFQASRRLILLGTKSPNTYLYNSDIARVLCRAIRDGRLPADLHVVARLHPIYYRKNGEGFVFQHELEEWRTLKAEFQDELSLDEPETIPSSIDFLMPEAEISKLAGLLKASAVVVNLFSTLNLEASIFDKPTVNVAFQFDHRRPPAKKVARFNIAYDEAQTHNRRIIESGGTVVVHAEDELVEAVRTSLENPSVHAAGRSRIVQTECGANLGRAGERIAERILEVAPRP